MNAPHYFTRRFCLVYFIVFLAGLSRLQASPIISVNFQDEGTAVWDASTSAGAVSAANWNHASRGGGNFNSFTYPVTPDELVDNSGTDTGATLEYTSSGNTAVQEFEDHATTPADVNMLSTGFGAYNDNGSLTVNVSDLTTDFTSPGYEVYVYWAGMLTASGNGDEVRAETTLGSETYYLKFVKNASDRSNYDEFDVATATTSATATVGPNTVHFGDGAPLTADNFSFTIAQDTSFDRRVGISGMQIVAIPEPATLALLVLTGLILYGHRRR